MGTFKPRTTTVLIYQDDDLDQIAEHRAKVERAAMTSRRQAREGDDEASDLATAIREYNDFLDEAGERAAKVLLAALRKDDWRELVAQHPPRQPVLDDDGDVVEPYESDREYGFNIEKIAEPLLAATFKRVRDLELEQPFDEADLPELCDADYERVYQDAVGLNIGAGPDPKARLSLPPAPTSSATSGSRGRLD